MDKRSEKKSSQNANVAFWINTMSGIHRFPFPSHGFFTTIKAQKPVKSSDIAPKKKELKEAVKKREESSFVILKNGAEHPKSIVILLANTLTTLAQKEPFIFYELVQKCRDPNYKVWRDPLKRLKELNFIDSNDEIHDITKDILLSSVTGKDEEMNIGDPIARGP